MTTMADVLAADANAVVAEFGDTFTYPATNGTVYPCLLNSLDLANQYESGGEVDMFSGAVVVTKSTMGTTVPEPLKHILVRGVKRQISRVVLSPDGLVYDIFLESIDK